MEGLSRSPVSALPANAGRQPEAPAIPASIARVHMTARLLVVEWQDGAESLFPFVWLRHGCQCALCLDPRNGQRRVEAAELPSDPVPRGLNVSEAGEIAVEWAEDGHRSSFAAEWLALHDLSPASRERRRLRPRLWGAELAEALPLSDWSEVEREPEVERRALALFRDYGFVLLQGVPKESGMVTRVGDRLGHVRVTNYGRHFDVVSRSDPNNLAYTEAALGVHTDNPYRDPPPGVQLLHCLEAGAPGGQSILVDGFRAAQRMRETDAAGFALLARHAVPFRFADATADLVARAPIIVLDDAGHVRGIHFNTRSAVPPDLPLEAIESWYGAYRNFAVLLRAPEGEVRLNLRPGDLLMMANHRVLHGRTAFDAGAGRRHLQGCYIDMDGVLSRLRVLERAPSEGA